MTAAASSAVQEAVTTTDPLEIEARALASSQLDIERAARFVTHFFEAAPVARSLERAQKYLSAAPPSGHTALPKAAEWFLDNYYLIRRIARQVEEDLPRGFVRHLPQLTAGTAKGQPRVDALARALVTKTEMVLDLGALRRFVDAYQTVSALTIAELWALPTMLRAAVLQHLLHFLRELGIPLHKGERHVAHLSGDVDARTEALSLEPITGVERSIRALRMLDAIDWKVFFEKTNRVEAVLRTDPSKVYARMDFETCDSYRKVVEALAWATGTAEEDVAALAITLARAEAGDERRGHVGYYLVANGRRALEVRLKYRAIGLDRLRRLLTRRPTIAYLLPLIVLTWVPLLGVAIYVAQAVGWSTWHIVSICVAVAVGAIPVSTVALAAIQLVLARVLPPRTLPKLDLTRGLPDGARTLVVMPTLLGRAEDVAMMLRRIETHYLSNPDAQLQFALLTDDVDAKTLPTGPGEGPLLASASRGIEALNARHGKNGQGPFHLLHRDPKWNDGEACFMGWERKRGKLEELNRLLRGDEKTTFSLHVGDAEGLLHIRFVITLDSDTELPMGSARRLVGLLAHPLNRAVFDAKKGRVTAGYTIVQPRIETSPSSSRRTFFSRVFAGDIGFDIYTHACSELYQDLFGAGIYVGKGIYDVDAFMRSVEGRAPENALVSHDLFEGIHGRTALASDIVLFESYPSNYATYALRMHRWVRGDWQLFPWLFQRVPSADGAGRRSSLSRIDRWKIADNLRRSLTSPLLLLLLVLGWVWLPGPAWLWTLGTLAVLIAPSLPGLMGRRMRFENLARSALAVTFLAYEATVVSDAVVRVLVRKTITLKNLLQWTSAAHAAFRIEARSQRAVYWRTMFWSPLLALAIGALVAWLRPAALVAAGPFLTVWFLAPEIARSVSRRPPSRAERVTPDERKRLRLLARRTWRFFDVFVGPNDQWLPVDNHQEQPREQTAHRTSPTNIGLSLLATLSAYDFGYIGPSELSLRVRRAFDSIGRMQHYQGHLLNWYDTKSLQPLLPRYVSTVDSGNLAGSLLALKQGCAEVALGVVVRTEAWEGLRDSIDLLDDVVGKAPVRTADSLRAVILRMQHATDHARENIDDSPATLRTLCKETAGELDRELLAFLETGAHRHEADLLHGLRTAIDRLHQQLQQMQRELDALLPWLGLTAEAGAHGISLPTQVRLDQVPTVSRALRAQLESKNEHRAHDEASPELDISAGRLEEAFRSAETNAAALLIELAALATRAEEEVRGMDFKLLYDVERKLFHIGYNATVDQVDPHHYDLLASEARLASYIAIVKRDVPEAHWYALGRPMTLVAGAPALLSWGGTMFEYLMPTLLMRSQPGTLLARTTALAVDAQIACGKRNKEPWGVSESAYARVDPEMTYQYRSFGVPGLGFKRGLEEDRVVTPYASVLGVSIRPRAVFDNVVALESMGMLGTYGLFEAVDFTPERVVEMGRLGQPYAIVRSYMAHHQGMLLVALGNFLNRRTMVDRFHADALIETGEVLLNEHAPDAAPAEWPVAEGAKAAAPAPVAAPLPAPAPWAPSDHGAPQAFVLSNGRLSSLLTGSGGGGLRWNGLALTRYQPDATCDDDGLWFYVHDEETRRIWRATSKECRTTYAMHKTEFHCRNEGISVHVDVAVAAADDVEVRLITLHNETNRLRRLTVTSAGRPVLFDAAQAPTAPAFSSMFIESERIAELDALLFARRPQKKEEEPAVLVHRLVRDRSTVSFAGYETDRGAFFGRTASPDVPESLALAAPNRREDGLVGTVIDPIMSLTAAVELKPKRSVTLAFVTSVARSRSDAIELARKYGSMHAVRWSFRDAEQESPRRLERTKLPPQLLPAVQRLFSALHFADPALRASYEARVAARPCQRRLWGRGISGDDPILLVRVNSTEAPLVRETLAAQRFLRSCGVRIDLVLVDEQASGYLTEGSGTLRTLLVQNEADEWLNRHGGVYVIAKDQVPEAEISHLEACARVILDSRDGSLAASLARVAESPPKLPRFEAAMADDTREVPRPRPKLQFDNGIGGFSEDGGEYLIAVSPGAPTPAPWCNVLANPSFGCLVSESSLGMSWALNSGENRLTPWRNDPVFDTPSEALYLRDEETAAVWSPTPLPAGRGEQTLVRHGAGYTTYERESHGLVQEMTVFVPRDATLKIVRLRLKNTLPRHRRLTATYYAEWVLGSRREAQRPYITSAFEQQRGCLLATCDWNAEFGGRVAFLASRTKAHGFTADRTEFIGDGDYALPEALQRWGLSGRVDLGADPCAALQVHLDLPPGDELETHFILGQSASRSEALELVTRFREKAVVDAAWTELGAFWDGVLGSVRVKTPEPAMDLLLNRWLLYQTLSSRVFGRTGFYQSGGAFGYRDQLQDVLALLHSAPAIARAHIVESAKHQFEQGDVLHWWHPPSGRGVRTRCSDDMAWLPYVTGEYVAATGDISILEEAVPFLEASPLRPDEHDRYSQYEASATSSPLFEHCRRAIEHALTEGAHGLPLMGDGDWNDGMSRVGAAGRGESVWLGWFLCATMDRFAALCSARQDGAEASKWHARAQSLRAKLEDVAWDGAWYLRAFHDDGSLVGSAKSRECRIDSIAQSWAVLSTDKGGSHGARSRAAVHEVDEQLIREADRLVLLFWPPFDSTRHDPGYIRGYPPGVRENGGQYTHAATWLGFAHVALGDGERAERVFRLLNPVARVRTAAARSRYRVEPYALAGDVYSCSPWAGRGGWTWYTGAAAWMWRLGVERILGIRKEGGHLHIEPCIPPTWEGFEAWVRQGAQTIHIVIENPDRVASGVATITLDGTKLESSEIRVDAGATGTREVRVRLGKADSPPPPLPAERGSRGTARKVLPGGEARAASTGVLKGTS